MLLAISILTQQLVATNNSQLCPLLRTWPPRAAGLGLRDEALP